MGGDNFQVKFIERPGSNNPPRADCFVYEECGYPDIDLPQGALIIRTLYLSVDPALRCLMNEESGAPYLKAWELGEPVAGLGGVGVVEQSTTPETYPVGAVVTSPMGWPWKLYFSTHSCSPALRKSVQLVSKDAVGGRLSLPLTCLGLVGLTSLLGIQEHGKPEEGETCVVSAAAGACGTLAGQIARLKGCCSVVGICGSDEKCDFLKSDIGFQFSINYKTEDVRERLKSVCPKGVDVYFDNVGGDISDAVIEKMNEGGRVVLCGQISKYNTDVPYPPPLPTHVENLITSKGISRERFLVLNYEEKFAEGLQQLSKWVAEGKLQVAETIYDGLEKTGSAFVDMMDGKNTGKMLVKVSNI